MATTLSESSFPSSASGLQVLAPPNSHDTSLHKVPNVLIVPPEEEHESNPPWTYFDAKTDAKAELETVPDIDALDVALGIFQQTDNRSPAFHRSLPNESSDTVIMPKKTAKVNASNDAKHTREMGEDIIEVVKVRRNEGMTDVTDSKAAAQLKKSRTFRARATQALRTIRGVASRGSRKTSFSSSTSSHGDPWPNQSRAELVEDDLEAGVLPRPSTPNVARGKSMQLSQLFSSTRKKTASNVTTESISTNHNDSNATPDVPESPASSEFSIISTPSEESILTPGSSLSDRTNQDLGATLNKTRSFVHKISTLDLQRLFVPSLQKQIPTRESSPGLRTTRRDSLPVPPSLPQLPHMGTSDDVFASDSPLQRPHSFDTSSNRYSLSLPPSPSTNSISRASSKPEDIPEETSFDEELRLDSLQFDSLHFDPDEFDLNL